MRSWKSVVLILLVAVGQQVSGQTPLEYRLELGESFLVQQNAQQEMVMEVENSKQIITNDLEALFSFSVVQKTVDGYILQFEFKDFAMKSSSNLQGVLMDVRASEPSEDDIMSAIFSGLIGTQLRMEMKKNGQITSVTGTDELLNKMVDTVEGLDEFTKNMMRKSLEKEFSSSVLSNSFEQMTYIYPDLPAANEKEWTTTFTGKINAQNEWRLEKTEDGVMAISGQAAITMESNDNNLNLSLSGSQETMVEAFESNGFIKKMMVRGQSSGSSTMAMAPGVEIPTILNQTITYQLMQE